MSINNLAFNSLTTNLTCCTDQGYIVYALQPNLEKKNYNELSGGVAMAKIFDNTNMMILVKDSMKSVKKKDLLILYDQQAQSGAIEMHVHEQIYNILITKTNIVVIMEKKISVFNWKGETIDTKLTYFNPHGLCAINPAFNIVVTLGTKKGEIAIWKYMSDEYKTIVAHQTNIESLALTNDGLSVATSSETGTLIRVFDIETKQLKTEFRRGTTSSTIYDLAFNKASTMLACCSDHGTVHFFDLNNNEELRKNTKSFFTNYGSYLTSYFDSQWSFKQFSLGNTTKSICAFDNDNNFHVVTYDGSYYKINPNKDEVIQGNLHINNK
jgi:WD40 repeat protein